MVLKKDIPNTVIMTDYDILDDPCPVCKTSTIHAVRTMGGKLMSTCMVCNTTEELDPDDIEELGYFPDISEYQEPDAQILQ